jgi:hypothetical protein
VIKYLQTLAKQKIEDTEILQERLVAEQHTLAKHFRLAYQYLNTVVNAHEITEDVLHCLTRAYWQLGAIQGKLAVYAEMQQNKTDKGKDND